MSYPIGTKAISSVSTNFGRHFVLRAWTILAFACAVFGLHNSITYADPITDSDRPNIVLVMADDMGWGQTGYYDHPVLKTPHLDAMAASGLRFDRFYAGAPVCSPTRASVFTGRTNDRTGVESHGYALRRQEKTLAQALRKAGYATGHFGKWHLNGMRGPGVPILADDDHNPSEFGCDQWLSVTNFFDRNPILSRNGAFEEFTGDSSEIIVDEALKFIRQQATANQPFLSVIWYGSPHSPWVAAEDDAGGFADLNAKSQAHYGELVAMDRSIGTLRNGLRQLKIEENTLVWFCSDNGGLPRIQPSTVGGLRGFKGSVYEGGLRVPAILEWPRGIPNARVTSHPACTMDMFPTLVDVVGLLDTALLSPQDGVNLAPMFAQDPPRRTTPIGFRHTNRAAFIDNNYKLVTLDIKKDVFQLYDLDEDPAESHDIWLEQPDVAARLKAEFLLWNRSVNASVAGKDYPEGEVSASEPPPRFWNKLEVYEPYFEAWRTRPEYESWLKRRD